MKQLRKWSRILHRDIGFFFIGTSIIYGLSGIAINHLKDWNPNYVVITKRFTKRTIYKNAKSNSFLTEWGIFLMFLNLSFFPDTFLDFSLFSLCFFSTGE